MIASEILGSISPLAGFRASDDPDGRRRAPRLARWRTSNFQRLQHQVVARIDSCVNRHWAADRDDSGAFSWKIQRGGSSRSSYVNHRYYAQHMRISSLSQVGSTVVTKSPRATDKLAFSVSKQRSSQFRRSELPSFLRTPRSINMRCGGTSADGSGHVGPDIRGEARRG